VSKGDGAAAKRTAKQPEPNREPAPQEGRNRPRIHEDMNEADRPHSQREKLSDLGKSATRLRTTQQTDMQPHPMAPRADFTQSTTALQFQGAWCSLEI
jgi:hypothetical protein